MRMKNIWILVLIAVYWPLLGCAQSKKNSEVGGLSLVVFNYSQEAVASLWINGKPAGGAWEAVPTGEVTGGGQTCCFSLDSNLSVVQIKMESAKGGVYAFDGRVEQPWPKDANTLIVHVMPGHYAVLEATLGVDIAPRSDLINERLSELGMKKEVDADQFMLSERNTYAEYMEVKK